MTEIVSNLFVGNRGDSERSADYDYVINCTKNIPLPTDTPAQRIPVDDTRSLEDQRDMLRHLYPTCQLLSTLLQQHKRVLVHCNQGQQRCPCVIAAYIIYKFKKSVSEAVDIVKSKKRDAFFCEINFAPCLHVFAKQMTNK